MLDTIWEKLRGHGVISGQIPDCFDFKTVVQYFTIKQLEQVMSNNHPCKEMTYHEAYRKAAENELIERNRLGKKRLDMPV